MPDPFARKPHPFVTKRPAWAVACDECDWQTYKDTKREAEAAAADHRRNWQTNGCSDA